MKDSTGRSRVALSPERVRTGREGGGQWTPQKLRRAGSYWQARILNTAAHLELFEWLGHRARRPSAAARHFGGTEEGWKIFLDALSAMGLLQKRAASYQNSSFALRYLCSGGGSFLLPDYDAWDVWERLPDFLTRRKRPKLSQPFFTDLKRTERLLRSLDRDARQIAPYLMARLRLHRSNTMLDVGGGLGSFTIACCRRSPHLRATIVEHPRVAIFTSRAVENAKVAKQVQVIALDIVKDPLPRGFDLVLISNVLHGQGVKENRVLLRSAYRCLNQGGRIVLRDVLMNRAGTHPVFGALFSVALLLHTPKGRCYALDEVCGWIRAAGFSSIQGPFPSSPLAFDPDSVLIAERS
jgi:precorrin-6B methylase 2